MIEGGKGKCGGGERQRKKEEGVNGEGEKWEGDGSVIFSSGRRHTR